MSPILASPSAAAAFLHSQHGIPCTTYALLRVVADNRTRLSACFACFRGNPPKHTHEFSSGVSAELAYAVTEAVIDTAVLKNQIQAHLQADSSLCLALKLAARGAGRGECLVTDLPVNLTIGGRVYSSARVQSCSCAFSPGPARPAVLVSFLEPPGLTANGGHAPTRNATAGAAAAAATTSVATSEGGAPCPRRSLLARRSDGLRREAPPAAGLAAAYARQYPAGSLLDPEQDAPLLAVSGACCCVTVVQYPGSVVYQNPRSIAYFGDLTGQPLGQALIHTLLQGQPQPGQSTAAAEAPTPGRFPLPPDPPVTSPQASHHRWAAAAASGAPERVAEMLASLEAGLEYEVVVQVPQSLADLLYGTAGAAATISTAWAAAAAMALPGLPPRCTASAYSTAGACSELPPRYSDRGHILDTNGEGLDRELLDALLSEPSNASVSGPRGRGALTATCSRPFSLVSIHGPSRCSEDWITMSGAQHLQVRQAQHALDPGPPSEPQPRPAVAHGQAPASAPAQRPVGARSSSQSQQPVSTHSATSNSFRLLPRRPLPREHLLALRVSSSFVNGSLGCSGPARSAGGYMQQQQQQQLLSTSTSAFSTGGGGCGRGAGTRGRDTCTGVHPRQRSGTAGGGGSGTVAGARQASTGSYSIAAGGTRAGIIFGSAASSGQVMLGTGLGERTSSVHDLEARACRPADIAFSNSAVVPSLLQQKSGWSAHRRPNHLTCWRTVASAPTQRPAATGAVPPPPPAPLGTADGHTSESTTPERPVEAAGVAPLRPRQALINPAGGTGDAAKDSSCAASMPSLACLLPLAAPGGCRQLLAAGTLQKMVDGAHASSAKRRGAALRRSSSQHSLALTLATRFAVPNACIWDTAPSGLYTGDGLRSATAPVLAGHTGAPDIVCTGPVAGTLADSGLPRPGPPMPATDSEAAVLRPAHDTPADALPLDRGAALEAGPTGLPAAPCLPSAPGPVGWPPLHRWSSAPSDCPDLRAAADLTATGQLGAGSRADCAGMVASGRGPDHASGAELHVSQEGWGGSLSSLVGARVRLDAPAATPAGAVLSAGRLHSQLGKKRSFSCSRFGVGCATPSPQESASSGSPSAPSPQPTSNAFHASALPRQLNSSGRRSTSCARPSLLRTIPDDERCSGGAAGSAGGADTGFGAGVAPGSPPQGPVPFSRSLTSASMGTPPLPYGARADEPFGSYLEPTTAMQHDRSATAHLLDGLRMHSGSGLGTSYGSYLANQHEVRSTPARGSHFNSNGSRDRMALFVVEGERTSHSSPGDIGAGGGSCSATVGGACDSPLCFGGGEGPNRDAVDAPDPPVAPFRRLRAPGGGGGGGAAAGDVPPPCPSPYEKRASRPAATVLGAQPPHDKDAPAAVCNAPRPAAGALPATPPGCITTGVTDAAHGQLQLATPGLAVAADAAADTTSSAAATSPTPLTEASTQGSSRSQRPHRLPHGPPKANEVETAAELDRGTAELGDVRAGCSRASGGCLTTVSVAARGGAPHPVCVQGRVEGDQSQAASIDRRPWELGTSNASVLCACAPYPPADGSDTASSFMDDVGCAHSSRGCKSDGIHESFPHLPMRSQAYSQGPMSQTGTALASGAAPGYEVCETGTALRSAATAGSHPLLVKTLSRGRMHPHSMSKGMPSGTPCDPRVGSAGSGVLTTRNGEFLGGATPTPPPSAEIPKDLLAAAAGCGGNPCASPVRLGGEDVALAAAAGASGELIAFTSATAAAISTGSAMPLLARPPGGSAALPVPLCRGAVAAPAARCAGAPADDSAVGHRALSVTVRGDGVRGGLGRTSGAGAATGLATPAGPSSLSTSPHIGAAYLTHGAAAEAGPVSSGPTSLTGRSPQPGSARRGLVQTTDRLKLLFRSLSQIQHQQQQQQLQQAHVGAGARRSLGDAEGSVHPSASGSHAAGGQAGSSRGCGHGGGAGDTGVVGPKGGVVPGRASLDTATSRQLVQVQPPPARRVWHKVHVVLSSARGQEVPTRQQGEQQVDRAAGPGGAQVMTLTVTQIDVTEQVEAQVRLAKLLEQEHKVLEGIFPRHVLEYMILNQLQAAGADALPAAAAAAGPAGAAGEPAGGPGGGGALGGGRDGSDSLLTLQPGSITRMASLASWHPGVTLLFADCVGFTSMCHAASPLAVMGFLNQLYSRFDALVDIYKVYKVETIGDCYMVAGGLVAYDDDGYKSVISDQEDPLHAVRVMEFAKAMLRASREVRMPDTGEPVQMRIGMHSGPVTSGVVGERMPRFCLFGDTVNTASRMESTCRPGHIHASGATQARLPSEAWRDRGMTAVKGKGEMRTYEWAGDVDAPVDCGQLHRVIGLYL